MSDDGSTGGNVRGREELLRRVRRHHSKQEETYGDGETGVILSKKGFSGDKSIMGISGTLRGNSRFFGVT